MRMLTRLAGCGFNPAATMCHPRHLIQPTPMSRFKNFSGYSFEGREDDDTTDVLFDGSENWEDLDFRGADLSDAYFNPSDHPEINLCRPDFTGANLRGTSFRHINFRQANFTGADLSGADFHDCFIYGVDFRSSRVRRIIFSEGVIADCDFRGMDLRDWDISQGILTSTYFSSDFRGADLRGLNAYHANFSRSDLRGANLEGVTAGRNPNWQWNGSFVDESTVLPFSSEKAKEYGMICGDPAESKKSSGDR